MSTDEETKDTVDEAAKAPVKTYTQAEVDRLVDIQKRKLKPISDELDALKAGKDEVLKQYEEMVQKTVDDMSKDIPEPVKKLLAKLTPLEQFTYLSDPENGIVFEKKEFPLSKTKAKGASKEFVPTPIDRVV